MTRERLSASLLGLLTTAGFSWAFMFSIILAFTQDDLVVIFLSLLTMFCSAVATMSAAMVTVKMVLGEYDVASE